MESDSVCHGKLFSLQKFKILESKEFKKQGSSNGKSFQPFLRVKHTVRREFRNPRELWYTHNALVW